MCAAILGRIDEAQGSGRLTHAGKANCLYPIAPADWEGPIRLLVGTDCSETLVVDARSPDGPGSERFELTDGPPPSELSKEDRELYALLESEIGLYPELTIAIRNRIDEARSAGRLSQGGAARYLRPWTHSTGLGASDSSWELTSAKCWSWRLGS